MIRDGRHGRLASCAILAVGLCLFPRSRVVAAEAPPSPVSASAATPDAQKQAQKDLAAGQKLLKKGQFEEALAKLRASYAADPSGAALMGMGEAERQLDRPGDAYRDYDKALSAPSGDLQPADREAAQRALAELAALTGNGEGDAVGDRRDLHGRRPRARPRRDWPPAPAVAGASRVRGEQAGLRAAHVPRLGDGGQGSRDDADAQARGRRARRERRRSCHCRAPVPPRSRTRADVAASSTAPAAAPPPAALIASAATTRSDDAAASAGHSAAGHLSAAGRATSGHAECRQPPHPRSRRHLRLRSRRRHHHRRLRRLRQPCPTRRRRPQLLHPRRHGPATRRDSASGRHADPSSRTGSHPDSVGRPAPAAAADHRADSAAA